MSIKQAFVIILLFVLLSVPARAGEYGLEPLSFVPVAMTDGGLIAGNYVTEEGVFPVVYEPTEQWSNRLSLPEGATQGRVRLMSPVGTVYGEVFLNGQWQGVVWYTGRGSGLGPSRGYQQPQPSYFGIRAVDSMERQLTTSALGNLPAGNTNERGGFESLSAAFSFMNERGMLAGGPYIRDDHGKLVDLRKQLIVRNSTIETAGVNESGQVLVNVRISVPRSAWIYLWNGGELKRLPTNDRSTAVATAFNDGGWVVGSLDGRPFLRRPGIGFFDLRAESGSGHFEFGTPVVVNNGGWIVAEGGKTGWPGVLLRPSSQLAVHSP